MKKHSGDDFKPLSDEEIKAYLKKIGKRMKVLRRKRGYSSQGTFAFEHELPRAQYGKYEAGGNLQMDSFLRVLHAYGVTPVEFFSEGFDK